MSTLVIRNARITTLDPQQPHAQALAVQEGASLPSAVTRRSCAAGATKRP
jgi:predicted amidohydrolase YtcJ